jgi:hypothetical protein
MTTNIIQNSLFDITNGDPLLDDVISGATNDSEVLSIPNWTTHNEFIVHGPNSVNNIIHNGTEYVSVSVTDDCKVKFLQQKLTGPGGRYVISLLASALSTTYLANDIAIYINNQKVYSTNISIGNTYFNPLEIEATTPVLPNGEFLLSILFSGVEGELSPLIANVNMNNQGLSERTNSINYSPIETFIGASKAKMVTNSNQQSLVLQVNDPAVVNQNKYKTYDDTRDAWVGGAFESQDLLIEDHISSSEDQEVYGPLGNFVATIQFGDSAISLKPKTTHGVSYRTGDGYLEEQLAIVMHDPIELANADYPNFTDLEFEKDPYMLFGDIPFNFLTKQPISLKYYNFDTGVMYGSSFKMKNPYNLEWNIDSVITNDEGDNSTGTLDNVRNYHKVGFGGGNVWTSYKIEDSYEGGVIASDHDAYHTDHQLGQRGSLVDHFKEDPEFEPNPDDPTFLLMKSSNILPNIVQDGDTFLGVHLSNVTNITQLGYKDSGCDTCILDLPIIPSVNNYQQVERISPASRSRISQGKHKSNIYSIKITDSGLNTSISDEDTRKLVQDSINTSIREVVKRAAPADTQLWRVIWDGE